MDSPTRNVARAQTLADYLDVVRRRKWLFLTVALVVPIVATIATILQTQMYAGTAQVLLKRQDISGSLTGVQAPYVDPARAAETEAELARVPEVLRRALARVPESSLTPRMMLKRSTVAAGFASDILTFSVRDPQADMARRLANAYAEAFTDYRRSLDAREVVRARNAIRQQLRALDDQGLRGSVVYRTLTQKERQIAAIEALQTPTAVVVREAEQAVKVPSNIVRNPLLGLFLGLLLGIAVVFLLEALDNRVRSVDSMREALGMRLLGKLPSPSSDLQRADQLVMRESPLSHEAEPFRMLRAGFEFANEKEGARTILMTSAVASEGKSTTVANLALALVRAGRHVVLADFDLRSPSLHRLFDLPRQPGLIEIERDGLPVGQALQLIDFDDVPTITSARDRSGGRLELLTAGRPLGNPDWVAAGHAFQDVLQALRERGDVVLIDSAPLLPIGDTLALSTKVDALVLVVKRGELDSMTFRELEDAITTVPTPKLGLILTGVDPHEVFGHYRYPSDSVDDDGRPAMRTRWGGTAAAGVETKAADLRE